VRKLRGAELLRVHPFCSCLCQTTIDCQPRLAEECRTVTEWLAQAKSALAGRSKGVSSTRIAAASASASSLKRRRTQHRCCPIFTQALAVVIRGLVPEAGVGMLALANEASRWISIRLTFPPSGEFWEPARER